MSLQDEIKNLLRQTPAYMTHVTVGRWLLDWLLRELQDKDREIKKLQEDLDNERRRQQNNL